jgi:hypothetical protein
VIQRISILMQGSSDRSRTCKSLRRLVIVLLGGGFVFQPVQGAIPSWAVEPPADSNQWIYVVGEGPDIEAARRSALRSGAARLRASVSGRVSDQVIVDGRGASRVSTVAVSEDILRTDFSGVELQSSARSPAGILALFRIDRQLFIRDTRAQLRMLAQPISEAEAGMVQRSSLQQYLALRQVGPQLENAAVLSQLLIGAGAETEGRELAARYGLLLERVRQLAASLSFRIRAAPADTDLVTLLAAYFSEYGLRSGNDGGATITVDSQGRQDELFGNKVVKLNLRLTLVDEQGRTVASRQFEPSGSSRYDHRAAREAALASWLTALRAAGSPMAALGLRD